MSQITTMIPIMISIKKKQTLFEKIFKLEGKRKLVGGHQIVHSDGRVEIVHYLSKKSRLPMVIENEYVIPQNEVKEILSRKSSPLKELVYIYERPDF